MSEYPDGPWDEAKVHGDYLILVRQYRDHKGDAQNHVVEFNVYAIVGKAHDGQLVFDGGTGSSSNISYGTPKAVYLSGYVKWDGCSDWAFDEQDRVMLHFCSRNDVKELGELLLAIYDLTDKWLDPVHREYRT